MLAKMVIRRAADSLTLFNRGATIVIAVRAASFRSVRGLTCVAAVADEIAFWQGEDGSANPDVEILRAVSSPLTKSSSADSVLSWRHNGNQRWRWGDQRLFRMI